MGIKIQSARNELNIPDYKNNSSKIAKFATNNSLEYVDDTELVAQSPHNNVIVGLEIKSYFDKLIISEGYFYDEIEESIIKFNPTTLNIDTSINGFYYLYYMFSSDKFEYSLTLPNERHKIIGHFYISNNVIRDIFPKEDLSDSFSNRFLIDEQLGSIGYRLYSDGWKVQWGNNENPVFPIAFNEIPRMIPTSATNVTTTNMSFNGSYWSACGY